MPIEIREIIIKTEIAIGGQQGKSTLRDKDLESLKKQLVDECRRMISDSKKRTGYQR